MGVGGAFIMPATLSIITNVFPTRERGKAIGVWAATAGLAGVLGPLTGGFLLEHFYWGSIFLVNIPIVAIGLLAGIFIIPTSKDPSAPRLHPVGAGRSIVCGTGLLMVTGGLVSWASLSATSAYWPDIIWRQALMASGMALTMAPATESIMGSLPLGKAGVGSAVNDTTRQVGGALGVAVIGSVLASLYGSQVGGFLHGKPVPSGTATQL